MSAANPALTGALIVPDEQTWTMSGSDPAAHGLRPVFATGQVERVLTPDVLPAPLDQALRTCLAELPANVQVNARVLPGLAGTPSDVAEQGEHAVRGEHGEHAAAHDAPGDEHDMRGGHGDLAMHGAGHHEHGGHGDMMAIVGEPSADGLVMEPIELRLGPLGTPLPGGLAVDVTLDGDVVAESTVHALLRPDSSAAATPSPPDLLAPVAWALAIDAAAEDAAEAGAWSRVAALEVERAVSHLAWLRALGRLLGWPLLLDRCTRALYGLPGLAHQLAARTETGADSEDAALSALGRAAAHVDGVAALVVTSRLLRMRTAGLGVLTDEQAAQAGLRGPAARASGIQDDVRAGHPLYDRLGFEPVVRTGGDAHARTLVRAEEARESVRLARAALRAAADQTATGAGFVAADGQLEGPRGPLRAHHGVAGWHLAAAGADEALRAAGEAMVGAEWAAALVALASFDLSPWGVGP
jgi:Respiratory-chain NADH dehydrogenase, 49 Kd subunit